MKIRIAGRVALLIAALLLVGNSCVAQHMNAKDGPCQTSSTGAEETSCFASELRKSDFALNQMYRRAEKVVEGSDLERLKNAQRLWIQFRDMNCDAEYQLYAGGSAASMVKLACLEAMTRHRTEELNVMYGWRLEKWEK